MAKKVLTLLIAFAIGAILLFLVVSVAPEEKADREMLHQVREDIGVGGILDYVLDYWSDAEIAEYLLGK